MTKQKEQHAGIRAPSAGDGGDERAASGVNSNENARENVFSGKIALRRCYQESATPEMGYFKPITSTIERRNATACHMSARQVHHSLALARRRGTKSPWLMGMTIYNKSRPYRSICVNVMVHAQTFHSSPPFAFTCGAIVFAV